MDISYKPAGYTYLSPYLIVDKADELVRLVKAIFGATEVHRFDHENGTIAHIELKLDDSVLMISNSTERYPAHKTMLHMYVPDVFRIFNTAIDSGCKDCRKTR